MGCPNICEFGDSLVFSVTTHDSWGGAALDADSAPTYRVYEEETATPIATGAMAKLDDANTTGFYSGSLAVTGSNGYGPGKTYTVLVSATVVGVEGAASMAFKVQLVSAALSHKRDHTVETGVDRIYDAAGTTVVRTLTPS
jgi:hypothetical protein